LELDDGELELVGPLITPDLGLSLAGELLGEDMLIRFSAIRVVLELKDRELEPAPRSLLLGFDEDEPKKL
jgi:hypothetical protein